MTKLKSKKMTKSTFAVIVLAILMVAMLAFGGTYAYFTSTTKDAVAGVSTGIIKLGQNTITLSKSNVVSGEKILDKEAEGATPITVGVDSTTNRGYWVFVRFEVALYDKEGTGRTSVDGLNEVKSSAEYASAQTNDTYFIDYAVDSAWEKLTVDGTTVYARHVATPSSITDNKLKVCEDITFYGKSAYDASPEAAQNPGGKLMGIYIEFTLSADMIQDISETTHVVENDAVNAYKLFDSSATSVAKVTA